MLHVDFMRFLDIFFVHTKKPESAERKYLKWEEGLK